MEQWLVAFGNRQDVLQYVMSLTGSVSYHSEPDELAETGPGKPAVHDKHKHSKVQINTTPTKVYKEGINLR